MTRPLVQELQGTIYVGGLLGVETTELHYG